MLVDCDAGNESVTENTEKKGNLTESIYMTSVESTQEESEAILFSVLPMKYYTWVLFLKTVTL